MTTSTTTAAQLATVTAKLDAHKSAADRIREEFDQFQGEVRKDFETIRLDLGTIKTLIEGQTGAKERAVRMWVQLIASIAAIAVALIALLK